MALPPSFSLLPLEIGALGYFCVLPVSKTSRELQGAGSELLGRGIWGGKGRDPSFSLWESSAPRSSLGFAFSLGAAIPQGSVLPESPKPSPWGRL